MTDGQASKETEQQEAQAEEARVCFLFRFASTLYRKALPLLRRVLDARTMRGIESSGRDGRSVTNQEKPMRDDNENEREPLLVEVDSQMHHFTILLACGVSPEDAAREVRKEAKPKTWTRTQGKN